MFVNFKIFVYLYRGALKILTAQFIPILSMMLTTTAPTVSKELPGAKVALKSDIHMFYMFICFTCFAYVKK